ncbi:unnamed protein product [Brassica rapa]|uniref:Uncharacterized protein n=1 Tax=Brassica campestris TaxID=3711 RepID=A0A8D9HJT9_BRACM|nr:unnamed protein product [Brassica rapa]
MIELFQYYSIHDHPRYTEIPIYKIHSCNWTGQIDDWKRLNLDYIPLGYYRWSEMSKNSGNT